jgi:hypothetical protein
MKKENSNDLTSSKEKRKTACLKERVQVTWLCDPACYIGGHLCLELKHHIRIKYSPLFRRE